MKKNLTFKTLQISKDSAWLIFVLTFAVFFPIFHSALGSAGAILVNGGLIVILISYFLINPRILINSFQDKTICFFLLSCQLIYLALILIGLATSAGNQTMILRDLFEIHRPILYILLILFGMQTLSEYRQIKLFQDLVIFFCGICSIMAIFQLFGLTSEIGGLYTKAKNAASIRAVLPFVSPYDLGFFLCLGVLLLLPKVIEERRLKDIFILLGFTISALLTQSRAIIGALGVTIVLLYPCILSLTSLRQLIRLKMPYKILPAIFLSLFSMGIGAFIFFKFHSLLDYLISGFNAVLTGQKMYSLDERQRQLNQAIELSTSGFFTFFVGNGPGKDVMPLVESSYTYFIFRYGFLGLSIVFFAPIIVGLLRSLKMLQSKSEMTSISKRFFLSSCLFLCFTLVASIGNNFTEQIRLSTVYYLMLIAIFQLRPKER